MRKLKFIINVKNYELDNETDPAVYVGTYAKYDNGDITGMWVDIAKCSDYQDFCAVCRTLHSDERDPEFMLQDFMNFPSELYCESGIDEDTFDEIKEFGGMNDEERNAYKVYVSLFGKGESSMNKFRDRYVGCWDRRSDFVYDFVNESGMLDEVPEWMQDYFDYDAFGRDLFLGDYHEQGEYVFRAC